MKKLKRKQMIINIYKVVKNKKIIMNKILLGDSLNEFKKLEDN